MQKQHYFIYKTTHKKSGRYYIGKHKTSNLDDGYLGSGTVLQQAFKKYGKDEFVREILEVCESEEEMNLREAQIVDQLVVEDSNSYNIKLGGQGGWDHCSKKGTKLSEDHKQKLSVSHKGKQSGMTGKKHSEKTKTAVSNKLKGRKRSPESIRKMIETRARKRAENENYGKWSEEAKVAHSETMCEVNNKWMQEKMLDPDWKEWRAEISRNNAKKNDDFV